MSPGSCESSLRNHPKYGTTELDGLTGRHCAELDTCWVVPVAAACVTFLTCIASSSYGYLYVLFMEELHVDRENAAWPQTALTISGGCAGLLVSVVQKKFSIYHITLVGGFITSAGVLASSFAPDIAWLSVTYGVIQGTGVGTTLLGVAMYLLLCFDKFKATATAIKDIGTVAAGVAGVPWISLCVKKYGLRGSLLLSAGLIMHILPLVMLIKTPRPFPTRQSDEKTAKATHPGQPDPCSEQCAMKTAMNTLKQEVQLVSPSYGKRPSSSNCHLWMFCGFTLFPFIVVVLLQVVSDYTNGLFMTTIVDYSADKGVEVERAKSTLMFTFLGQAVGRIVMPLATDKISFSRSPIAVACLLATTVSYAIITRVSAFEEIVALSCLAGVAQGYIHCIRPVLVADHVGLGQFSLCCGVGGLVGVPVYLSGPAILGFFRDRRGSYDRLYIMLAGLNLGVAVLLTVLVFQATTKRRRCIPEVSPGSTQEESSSL